MTFKELKERFGFATLVIGVIVPLWSGLGYFYAYEKSLVKQHERTEDKVDILIGIQEIKVDLYSTQLPQKQDKYDRAKARLINLEKQRDDNLGDTDN